MANAFVEFGSGDPSIVLQSSLKSQDSVLTPDIGPAGAEKTPADITYDSELGMTFADGSNAVVSWVDAVNFPRMNYGFQVSWEVETAFISELFTDAQGAACGSDGFLHPTSTLNTALFAITNVGGTTMSAKQHMYLAANGAFYSRGLHQGQYLGIAGTTTIGKGRFCLVTLSAVGDTVDLWIDKYKVRTLTGPHLGYIAEKLFAGNDRGNADRGIHGGYYMRNFVAATRPIMFPILPKTRKIVWLGDSFTNQAGNSIGSTLFDGTVGITMQRALHDINIGVGSQVFRAVSGGTWANAGTTIQTELANAVADDGDIYLMYGGWNDCALNLGASIDTASEVDFKVALASIINNTRASAVIIVNQTAFAGLSTHPSSQYNPNVARWNVILDNMAAYAETVKAGWGSKVFVSNANAATGGELMPVNYTKGGLSGLDNDPHPSAHQSTVVGKAIAETLIVNVLK